MSMVRQAMQAKAEREKKRKSASVKSTDPQAILPLRVAFFAVFHILDSVSTGLEPRVAELIADLARDFSKIEDADLYRYCLLVLFTLKVKHLPKTAADELDIYAMMAHSLNDSRSKV